MDHVFAKFKNRQNWKQGSSQIRTWALFFFMLRADSEAAQNIKVVDF